MPTDFIVADSINVQELQQALADAPELTARFVKSELTRFARRVRRLTIRSMSGAKATGPTAKPASAPLFGGQFKRGKHIQGFTVGKTLADMKAVSKISRIVRVHEEGATISAKSGGLLFLSRKTDTPGKGKLFAKVASVTIPKRLRFHATWQEEIPHVQRKTHEAMERAVRVAMERRMKAVSGFIARAVA